MIFGYGGRNCWAFKEWLEISFRINGNVPAIYGFKDASVVPVLCFEGGNASGKSSALRVLSFIRDFCINSFFYPADSEILFDNFFNNNDKSEFFISFALENNIEKEYVYECLIDKRNVYKESLYYYEDKRKKYLIKRKDNKIVLNNFAETIGAVVLRNNCSFISTFIQYGIPEINPFKQFFTAFNSNVSYYNTMEEQLTDYVAEFYGKNPELHQRVCKQLKLFDTGIEDVQIIKGFDSSGKETYISSFTHSANTKNRNLSYYNQSTGTKLLYNRLKDFFIAIDTGGVLIFDEIDMHLHSRIVPHLFNYFLDERENNKHAQLVFTSHNSSILDEMKKYRTYLFNKEDGESFCYRVDELPDNMMLRNERSLEAAYKSGLLGGVPNA